MIFKKIKRRTHWLADESDKRSRLLILRLHTFTWLTSLFINRALCKIALKIHSNLLTYKSRANTFIAAGSVSPLFDSVFKSRWYFISTDKSTQYTSSLIKYIAYSVHQKSFCIPVCLFQRYIPACPWRDASRRVVRISTGSVCLSLTYKSRRFRTFSLAGSAMKCTTLTLITIAIVLLRFTVSVLAVFSRNSLNNTGLQITLRWSWKRAQLISLAQINFQCYP